MDRLIERYPVTTYWLICMGGLSAVAYILDIRINLG